MGEREETMSERIIQLANELIEEVQKAGYQLVNEYTHEDGRTFNLGKMEIILFDHIKDTVAVGNVCGKWEVKGKLTTKVWEGQHE